MNLHGQMMNLHPPESGVAGCYEYKVGHRDARHAAAELALKYDAIVEETGALISQLIHDLDHIGSDGWCRGDVHGDELNQLVALNEKLKAL